MVSGTARNVPWHDLDLQVHGKTGTAEISTRGDNNAWFAGYLPRTHPDVPLLAFAAVAYFAPDKIHGADIAGGMIADLLRFVDEGDELRHRYLRREGQR